MRTHKLEKPSMVTWSLVVLLVGFLIIAPFYKGLFIGGNYLFNGPNYGALIAGSLMMLLLAIKLFNDWKIEDKRHLLALYVWLIPLTYFIAYFFAASKHDALNAVYIHLFYAAIFIAGLYLATYRHGLATLKWGLFAASYVIVLFGFINLFGYNELFYYEDAVMYTNVGLRITSVFQYANTYSAFLMAILLATLIQLIHARHPAIIALCSFMLVPIIVSFALTLSRGGLLILPLVIIFLLPFLRIVQQFMFGIHLLIAGIAAMIISEPISSIAMAFGGDPMNNVYGQGFTILFGTAAMTALILFLLQRYVAPKLTALLEPLAQKRFSYFMIPAVFVIIGLIGVYALFGNTALLGLLPDNLQERVENINFQQHSVLERQTFYSNALDMVKDHPLFGAGGNAWANMYQAYQTNPYTSSQAHSFYFKVLVEVGIVGFLIYAVFFLTIIVGFITYFIRHKDERRIDHLMMFIFAIAILVHSAIDFNMSYMYIASVVFLCLGLAVSDVRFTSLRKWASTRWIKPLPVAMIVIALLCLFSSIKLLQANMAFKEAIAMNEGENIPFYKLKDTLDHAISKSKSPEFMNYKVRVLSKAYQQVGDEDFLNEAMAMLEMIDRREPYNRLKVENEFTVYADAGEVDRALQALEDGLDKFSWDMSLYERTILLNYSIGTTDPNPYNEHWERALQLYDEVLDKIEELALLPEAQLQGRQFEVTEQMIEVIDRINAER